jgi:ribokinase
MANGFCVVGSLNMDMVTRVSRFPAAGETMCGESFRIFPGGKGANQAVALARLGASVQMVGAIGDDMLGAGYRDILLTEGVGVEGLRVATGRATGTASIEVTVKGENHIIIVGGANDTVDAAFVAERRSIIEASGVLLLQLEVPLTANLEAARIAKAKGIPVILDPAPARKLPAEFLSLVSFLTPNETEAAILSGEDTSTEDGIRKAANALMRSGVRTVVVKAGKRGAYLVDGAMAKRFPTVDVEVVDTVAAGDSFNAGLAYALGRGDGIEDALRFANAVGALSTTKEGAQSAMPRLAETEALLAAHSAP